MLPNAVGAKPPAHEKPKSSTPPPNSGLDQQRDRRPEEDLIAHYGKNTASFVAFEIPPHSKKLTAARRQRDRQLISHLEAAFPFTLHSDRTKGQSCRKRWRENRNLVDAHHAAPRSPRDHS